MSAAQAQGSGCKLFRVEVPDARAYASNFVAAKAVDYVEVERYVDEVAERDEGVAKMLDELVVRGGWPPAAYAYTYCRLKNFRTALLVEDGATEAWDVVVFDLPEDEAKRIVSDMLGYINAIERASDAILDDEERADFDTRCYLLAGGRPGECLAKANEILAKA